MLDREGRARVVYRSGGRAARWKWSIAPERVVYRPQRRRGRAPELVDRAQGERRNSIPIGCSWPLSVGE
jgi:hypothetical protein